MINAIMRSLSPELIALSYSSCTSALPPAAAVAVPVAMVVCVLGGRCLQQGEGRYLLRAVLIPAWNSSKAPSSASQ